MSVENPIPADYVQQNQKFWREAKRGSGSRPFELPRTTHLVHERMVRTFDLEDASEPILAWSILYDRARTPSAKYVYQDRIPVGIPEEVANDYIVGMSRITEYATNRAVKLFIGRNLDLPLVSDLGKAYARITDLLTYEILLNGTYRRMAGIEVLAKQNGRDYDKAITDALFKHDLAPLDSLVADTEEFSGWTGISDLAIEIGQKKWKKPNLAKWTDKLEVEENNGRLKTATKSIIAAIAAGGVSRAPGVSEVNGGFMAFLLVETGIVCAATFGALVIQHPDLLLYAPLPAIFLAPALGLHELIHTYTFDEKNYGLIPATLIHKEKVPYLARLEQGPRNTSSLLNEQEES